MDNKKNASEQLSELLQNNIKNAEAMSAILLSPDYEAELIKDLSPEQKAEFFKARDSSDLGKAKKDLADKMEELNNLKNGRY